MSLQTAAERLITTLGDEIRLHMAVRPDLKISFDEKQYSLERRQISDAIGKPVGLWYGFGGSWMEWCLSEMPDWMKPHLYEVLVDSAKVRRITNIEEFEKFEDEYFYLSDFDRRMQEILPITLPPYGLRSRDLFLVGNIDWTRVAQDYSGVEITPYLYKKRLSSRWYYGWDCAAGCVWQSGFNKIVPFASYDPAKDEFARHCV